MGVKQLTTKTIIAISASVVSVPLRGNGCETAEAKRQQRFFHSRLFPSPCGVMGVKQQRAQELFILRGMSKVSVPLRGNGCETRRILNLAVLSILTFPSPCGVMGVKR